MKSFQSATEGIKIFISTLFSFFGFKSINLLNSRQVHQKATSRRGPFDGKSTGNRQTGFGVDLLVTWRERIRLEINSRRHHARKFH